MVLVDNGPFIKSMRLLFEEGKKGSVFVTFKSVPADTLKSKKEKQKGHTSDERVLLARVTNGKDSRAKRKFSTHVRSKDVVSFQLAIARVLNGAADNLKKPARKKKKRSNKRSHL
eukprot:TRINITY_DN653_c0_g1_i2.p1 TRINITY_DN653_c0_g1~~TRINITY_DN653_c0_g1_i2.p1  ORF type:complete len:115 (+),score=40.63 TRINITY_DN653_c0_g1_i2:175-519(+)